MIVESSAATTRDPGSPANEIRVGAPQISSAAGANTVGAPIDLAGSSFDLWYKSPAGPLNTSAEPFLAAALIPAMKLGVPLRLSAPISPRLLKQLGTIQQVLHGFVPELRPIKIMAELGSAMPGDANRKVGCFFSAGMDSFYTCLKHRDEIDELIFVHGFDIRLGDQDVYDRVAPSIRAAARELGKPLVEIAVNVQTLTDPFLHWNYCHGAAMAGVALLVSPLFRKVYVSATHTYPHLRPWGSHPLLDPLWSTEAVEIVHDGCEATRVDKAALISTNDVALKYLRVCYQNRKDELRGVYNCGKCEKCLRTKINLHLVGALDRCKTLDPALDMAAIALMPLPNDGFRRYASDNLELAQQLQADPALITALQAALNRSLVMEGSEATEDSGEAIRRLEQENAALRTTIAEIHASDSWRITKSLRAAADLARGLRVWDTK